MPRRFRLHRIKDYERRKKQNTSSDVLNSDTSSSEVCSASTLNTSDEGPTIEGGNTPGAQSDSSPLHVTDTENDALRLLQSSVVLPDGWSDHSPNDLKNLLLCRISSQACSSSVPLQMTHCVKVERDMSWSLFVYQHHVDITKSSALTSFPFTISSESLTTLLSRLNTLSICIGQPDSHFVKMVSAKKGKVVSQDGQTVAYVDEGNTVRTTNCELVSQSSKCQSCKAYRTNLRSMYNRWSKQRACDSTDSTSSHTNDRYLNTPEKKARLDGLRKRVHAAEEEVKRLKDRVAKLLEHGEPMEEMHSDLLTIMKENTDTIRNTYPENSFPRLFWEEQLKAACKDPRQARWHPTLIRWCLNLKLLSSSAYHALRTSGFIKLPSERTLRDYVHYFTNQPGFQGEVHQQLLQEAKIGSLPENRRFVSLISDEMKVKEGLVYNKHSGQMIGFTDLGNVNNELLKLEHGTDHPPIANHVLTLMVRGILFKMEFPYAHFATQGVTADFLYPIVWEAIRLLEADGVKVLCITTDGASPNRKFFRMHTDLDVPHKTKNPYAKEERFVYFISDPPHLIKTVRNCWSHSGATGSRHMQLNGQYIEWKQLWEIYEKLFAMSIQSHGLTIAPKLKLEHLKLTSYSRMRVDLAAQVLSKTVADTFAYFGDPSTTEAQLFVTMFDKLFDCLNVRSLDQWIKKRKPDLKPYTTVDDPRFKWLKEDFLGYLSRWESAAQEQVGLSAKDRRRLLLSSETMEGLRMTVNSFVELAQYLLSDNTGDLFLLSERLTQDPLENYFGQQRARGGRNENPSVQQCLYNAAAIRVQKSLASDPVRGNCKRKLCIYGEGSPDIDDTPLPKRKRH